MSEITRIGREPNAAERGLQLMSEHAEILDRAAMNLFIHETGLLSAEGADGWKMMSESRRDHYKAKALRLTAEHVLSYTKKRIAGDSNG